MPSLVGSEMCIRDSIPIPIFFFYNMAQQSTTQVPAPSPLSIALATAGIIDEVVPEESQNQILDLTTVSDSDPVPSTSSTPTPYEIFYEEKREVGA